MRDKSWIAWTGITIISLLPGALFLILGNHSSPSALYTLGRFAGIVGMTMFALTSVLSTRAYWIEGLFGGLDKVYLAHGILGGASLLVLLLHPVMLVTKYIPGNFTLAAKYLVPGGLISVDMGIYALAGMVLLVVLTLYAKLTYANWKVSHEFMGLVFAFGVYHTIMVPRDVAVDSIFPGYQIYAIAVSAIGLGAFTYSLLLRRWQRAKRYRIVSVKRFKDGQEITMSPLGRGLTYRAGQFVFVRFENDKVKKESHPFSIASKSGNGQFRIFVKKLGDFTGNLESLREGNTMLVEGPYGRFHKDRFGKEVWIAGGIGITPFLGLAQDFAGQGEGQVVLYYSVKSKEEFVGLFTNPNSKMDPNAKAEIIKPTPTKVASFI